ncbi:cholecystokinin receptor type A-like [Haliotis rubra]|uniref:cholecystokinin receptor type A-like n=1 Tax=Haliotis rubra TaxID=36100 RepID=UPI001EE5F7D7|nr:cholecystokinin receptor type A-like [Haliotis rubra]
MTEDDVELILQNLTNNQNLSELLFHPSDEKSVFEQVTKICFYTITIVVGFCANGLIVVVISGTNSLRTKFNFYVVNLAVADVLVIMFCSWIHLVSDLKQQWILGSFMCTANAFVQGCGTYNEEKCQSGMILAIWTAAVLVAIPWALYVKQVEFHWATGLGIACEDVFPSQEFKKVYTTLFAVVMYMIPLCAMFALLFAILNTPRKPSRVNEHSFPGTEAANEHQVSMTRTSDQVHDRRTSEHSFPGTEAANEHQVSMTRTSDQVHDRRLSENSFPGTESANEHQVSMARTSDQAVNMTLTLLVVFFICWTPQQTTLLWDIYRDRHKEKPNGIFAFKYIALYMAYSSSAVNPVVYMMFNKCFRIAAWKSLRFWKKGENSVLTVCPCKYLSNRKDGNTCVHRRLNEKTMEEL